MSGISINSNIASLRAQSRVSHSSEQLREVLERLSSGQRINRASDDAAGLAIASSLNADARVFTQGIRNINDGISALNIASGTLDQLTGVMMRLRELSTQSANGVFSRTQRLSLDTEAFALTNEFNRLASSTTFNGLNLLNGQLGRMSIQLGYGSQGSIGFNLGAGLSQNVGTGSFQEGLSFSQGALGRDIEMADLNGDGAQDLVYAAFFSNPGLFVRLGNGDGTFGAAVSYNPGGTSATGIAIADLDGDGDNDIALTTITGSPALSIFMNNGDGTFKASVSYLNSLQASAITIGDLNGDGAKDIITRGGNNFFEVFINNGNGTYQAAQSYAASGVGTSALLTDFNNDGKLDLVTNSGSNTEIFLGNGNGTFRAGRILSQVSVGQGPSAHAVGDINHDGYQDLISTVGGGEALFIYLGNGDGSFRAPSTILGLGGFSMTVKLHDLNGDGYLDLVSGQGTGTNKIKIFSGNGDGSFKMSASYDVLYSQDIAIGDVNGDGVPDIVNGSYNSNVVHIAFQQYQTTTSIGRINLTTRNSSLDAIGLIDAIMQRLSKEKSNIGSAESRLLAALSNLQATRDTYLESAGRITNVDVAQESAALVRQQILQQVGAAVLAQANQAPALALQLLR